VTPAAADLRPVVVSVDTPERFAAWRALDGQAPDTLACVEGAGAVHRVCLRVWERATRRFVLGSDLAAWRTDAVTLLRTVAAAAEPAVGRAELVPVEGTDERYLRLLDSDGWSAVGLLRPDLVAERLGGGAIRVAVPNEGVLLAWTVRDPTAPSELDRLMSVGVREWYDRAPAQVSPRVLTWDGAAWTVFGEAVPRNP
jgi:hypothetical protein